MSAHTKAGTIIGESAPVVRLRDMIRMAGPTNLPVLIEGPTGVGKELVAAALHAASGRHGPFVAFNVCAITESMFEDALFGHVRGAYTGAFNDTAGFLVEAHRGTAFFDEIGGLQLGLQAKLLRAIETGEFRPLGGKCDVHSDFRVVAATNEGMNQLVADRRVRSDLAHRIGAVVLHVPPLEQRLSDVPLLVRHFLERAGRSELTVGGDAMRELQQHHWPGNVRELKQVIEWAGVMARATLTADTVKAAMRHRSQPGTLSDCAQQERGTLREVLNRHAWNTESAARELGVHRATLYRRMKQLRLTALSPRRSRVTESGGGEALAG